MRRLNHMNYRTNVSSVEDVYETPNEPIKALVKQSLQTRQIHEELHNQLGALGKYVNMLLGNDREKAIDHVYGIYFSENCTMLDDKYFDVDTNDFVIVDRVKYIWLYELIFKRIPNTIYRENDKLAYNNILSNEGSYECAVIKRIIIVGSKGCKYKNIIALLV